MHITEFPGCYSVFPFILPCYYKVSFLSLLPSPLGEAKGGECSDPGLTRGLHCLYVLYLDSASPYKTGTLLISTVAKT